ncbi:ATP-binding protein [Aliamphritea ceti]|uniref:ATP-binding protein n=1 Tax=Aliamphritea ceti TaxID=1524258 RepID=UPI0021C272A8|nr:ATP-binding protein [Aliamphritea ceti]
MATLPLPPVAGPFIQSLRSIGYSLESAVADVIDNSISAQANTVDIYTEWRNSDPVLAVMDDGHGMSPNEAQAAMQLGAVGPADSRSSEDLGRFGMGLKTASFSQCKSLTLITRKSAALDWYGLRWDLDLVERENSWLVVEMDPAECQDFLNEVELSFSKGTAVIWNTFDRAIDPTAVSGERDYDRRIVALIDHLALTFHRFIRGEEVSRKVNLRLNGKSIAAKDPFATKPEPNKQASTILSNETIRLGACSVGVKAYLLPHPTNLSHSFAKKVSQGGDHHSGQGIYIYRAGRLIVSGGWHRLAKASEANKLARIQVDFGNDADSLWRIDVRKSRVDLPSSLREQLRRVITQCAKKSSTTFTRRAKMPSVDPEPVWQRVFDRDKSRVHYILNRKHSALSEMLVVLGDSDTRSALIKLIESSLPVELIKNDMSATNIKMQQEPDDLFHHCIDLAEELFNAGIDKELIQRALVNDSNIGLTPDKANKIVSKLGTL